ELGIALALDPRDRGHDEPPGRGAAFDQAANEPVDPMGQDAQKRCYVAEKAVELADEHTITDPEIQETDEGEFPESPGQRKTGEVDQRREPQPHEGPSG